MTEILNERGRARAGGPERAAQACLQPNAIGENAGESARGPQVLRAHSVRTGERVVRTQARTQHVGEADVSRPTP